VWVCVCVFLFYFLSVLNQRSRPLVARREGATPRVSPRTADWTQRRRSGTFFHCVGFLRIKGLREEHILFSVINTEVVSGLLVSSRRDHARTGARSHTHTHTHTVVKLDTTAGRDDMHRQPSEENRYLGDDHRAVPEHNVTIYSLPEQLFG